MRRSDLHTARDWLAAAYAMRPNSADLDHAPRGRTVRGGAFELPPPPPYDEDSEVF